MKRKKDFYKGFLTGVIVTLFAAYSFFRIYWITEVGLLFFRWHAVLWLYISVALVITGISYLLYKYGKLKSPLAQKIYLVVLGVIVAFYAAEIMLRLQGRYITYSETREGMFVNLAERAHKTWYVIWQPNQIVHLISGDEYSFSRNTNSEGLSDVEWTTTKDSNEIKILTLGDSFTEGDGAAVDFAYPKLLERILQSRFPKLKINVMNGGHCGSDPWFEYKKLSDRLLKYKPDIVVYTNCSNDLEYDHLVYGGMERFSPDFTVKNKILRHWWNNLFCISHLARLVADNYGYDQTLFSEKERNENIGKALSDSKLIAKEYSRLAAENNFNCVQVVFPGKGEIENGCFNFKVKELIGDTDTLPNYRSFDLLQFYTDSLHINKENVKDYFWKIDAHHNAKGYAAMAHGVASCLQLEIETRRSKTVK